MLNIGQVIYNYTDERVIVFADMSMFQNEETGKCHSESGFVLED